MGKSAEIECMNDRAIATLKVNTLRRVKFFKFANRELIDGVMDDLSNVGWHVSLEIDWSDRLSEITWYITAPPMSAEDQMEFGNAEGEDLKL
jgi:hypothetical protein